LICNRHAKETVLTIKDLPIDRRLPLEIARGRRELSSPL